MIDCLIGPTLKVTLKREPSVVYHLHRAAGRSTVWVNGKQNLGLVNFVTESQNLPFVQIGSICWKNDRKGMKLVSKMATTFSSPLLLEIFRWNDPDSNPDWSRVQYTFQRDVSGNFLKMVNDHQFPIQDQTRTYARAQCSFNKHDSIITLHAQTGFIQKPLENDLLITIRFLAYFLSDGNQKSCIWLREDST